MRRSALHLTTGLASLGLAVSLTVASVAAQTAPRPASPAGAAAPAPAAKADPDIVTAPETLALDGVEPVPASLRALVQPYTESRGAGFAGFDRDGGILISTRFAETNQLHNVKIPGGARTQITFEREPVNGAALTPKTGDILVFGKDVGGGEFFQLYSLAPTGGRPRLLTDGQSRNTGGAWSRDGKTIAYSSTKRTGRDTDIWVMDPRDPSTAKLVLERQGGGWSIGDWSADGRFLILSEGISATHSKLHLLELATGTVTALSPDVQEETVFGSGRFLAGDRLVLVRTNQGAEFEGLAVIDPATRKVTPIQLNSKWGVEGYTISDARDRIAFTTNEDGLSVLHLGTISASGQFRETAKPNLPAGTIGGLDFDPAGKRVGFSLSSANSPSDVHTVDVAGGKVTRWTQSETGGLDPASFVKPDLIRIESFDGVEVSGFLYRPDPKKFPGKRPVLINIHGGPEGQSRPGFQGTNNVYTSELGIALFFPNVRGSTGYGKTFLALDNGLKREDSVKDIGAFLDALAKDEAIDGGRVAVIGGSYGGYMTLAAMVHYSDRLKAGVDIVGISNFVTFLKNTQGYRVDLRRVEYGDERDPAMAKHLEAISPLTNVAKIQAPLMVVQGANDPRVPMSEAEQIVKAVRANGQPVPYILGKDEGHGFQKKTNRDYQTLATIQFLAKHLGVELKQP